MSKHPLALPLLALPVLAAAPRIRRWHLHWGATDAEVNATMPGDEQVPAPDFIATRAITIDAHPKAVWPWLMQVGVGRAGFYSYDLLDNHGQPSAEEILPEWQDVHVGDIAAPMVLNPTPDMRFIVNGLDVAHWVVWVKPNSSWAWTLTPLPMGGTRLVTRLKQEYPPGISGVATAALLEFADFPMMRRMLLGIRRRAEAFDHYPPGYAWPQRAKHAKADHAPVGS